MDRAERLNEEKTVLVTAKNELEMYVHNLRWCLFFSFIFVGKLKNSLKLNNIKLIFLTGTRLFSFIVFVCISFQFT